MSDGQPASARCVIANSRAVCGRGLVTVAPERNCSGDGFVKENDKTPQTEHARVERGGGRWPMFGFDGFVVLQRGGNCR